MIDRVDTLSNIVVEHISPITNSNPTSTDLFMGSLHYTDYLETFGNRNTTPSYQLCGSTKNSNFSII